MISVEIEFDLRSVVKTDTDDGGRLGWVDLWLTFLIGGVDGLLLNLLRDGTTA